jgi:hypothetical protein
MKTMYSDSAGAIEAIESLLSRARITDKSENFSSSPIGLLFWHEIATISLDHLVNRHIPTSSQMGVLISYGQRVVARVYFTGDKGSDAFRARIKTGPLVRHLVKAIEFALSQLKTHEHTVLEAKLIKVPLLHLSAIQITTDESGEFFVPFSAIRELKDLGRMGSEGLMGLNEFFDWLHSIAKAEGVLDRAPKLSDV